MAYSRLRIRTRGRARGGPWIGIRVRTWIQVSIGFPIGSSARRRVEIGIGCFRLGEPSLVCTMTTLHNVDQAEAKGKDLHFQQVRMLRAEGKAEIGRAH